MLLRFLRWLLIGALALAAAACGASPVDECLKAKNVLECQQVVSAGGNAHDYLLYGMAGYMLGSVMNGGQRQTVIVADPSWRGYRRPVASYQASPAVVRQRMQTVTTRTTVRNGSAVTSTVRTKTWSAPRTKSSYRSTVSYRSSFGRGK